MQAALAALATLGVTVTLDGDCGRTELAATSPAPYNSATKCTKLKNIDNLESICDSSYYVGDDLIACSFNTQIEKCRVEARAAGEEKVDHVSSAAFAKCSRRHPCRFGRCPSGHASSIAVEHRRRGQMVVAAK